MRKQKLNASKSEASDSIHRGLKKRIIIKIKTYEASLLVVFAARGERFDRDDRSGGIWFMGLTTRVGVTALRWAIHHFSLSPARIDFSSLVRARVCLCARARAADGFKSGNRDARAVVVVMPPLLHSASPLSHSLLNNAKSVF